MIRAPDFGRILTKDRCYLYPNPKPTPDPNPNPKPNPNPNMPVGENALAPDKKLHRVIFGDSWFASLETLQALRDKLGVHFVGVTKTGQSQGLPA
jgi:hypothetical protein